MSSLEGARVAITGGMGLIGSHLAKRLSQIGCDDILLIDSLNENFGGNLFNIEEFRDRVRINISDVRDKHGLRFMLRDRDVIFNLAGQTSHMDSMNAPFEDLEINCTAQLSLLEVCRDVNPHARIIFASTRQVYGRPQFLPVDESHPVTPVDVNGINKVAGENYHRLYHDVYGLKTTVLRLTNTYGPHMRIKDARQIFLGFWIRQAVENRAFEVWGGQQRRDFTYVDDAAEAFISAVRAPSTIGKILNVGGSEVVRLVELAELVVSHTGSRYRVKDFPRQRKVIDIGDYYTDDTGFRRLTGWQPQIGLELGVRQSIQFYRENLEAYL